MAPGPCQLLVQTTCLLKAKCQQLEQHHSGNAGGLNTGYLAAALRATAQRYSRFADPGCYLLLQQGLKCRCGCRHVLCT